MCVDIFILTLLTWSLYPKFTSCNVTWIRKMADKTNCHPWVAAANIILKEFGGVKTSFTFCSSRSGQNFINLKVRTLHQILFHR